MKCIRVLILLVLSVAVLGCQGQSDVHDIPEGDARVTAVSTPRTSLKKAVDSAEHLNSLAAQHNKDIEEQAGE